MHTHSPAPRPGSLPTLRRVTGHPVAWSRDLAVVGSVTGFAAPYLTIFDPGFALMSGAAGLFSGAVLGAAMCVALDHVRGRVPIPVLLLITPVAGCLWGGFSGAVGGLVAPWPWSDAGGVMLGATLGALAGTVQLGWLWFPYTVQSVVGGSRWPLVLTACAVAPTLGWVAAVSLIVMPALFPVFVLAVAAVAAVLAGWAAGLRVTRVEPSGR